MVPNKSRPPNSLRVKWRNLEVDASGTVGVVAGFALFVLVLVLTALPYLRLFW